ncbi:MAG TPA: branched-chain amino acid ABC transporter permease, partial [Acidimicrobiia bacterium]|nr:branched-chain amino acid ABC transporter permease [Acidimicrobiia bacterium]
LYTSYEADAALLNTPAKKLGVLAILVGALFGPFVFADDILSLLATAFAAAIGAIGLNLVTGYAGQVSLGHAFFLGVGAFTAATISGDPGDSRLVGYGLDMLVWLPAAGIVAALCGFIVSPAAVRLRGLYLAVVTLGLVFLGEHIFRAADTLTGGIGVGRQAASAQVLGYRFDEAGPLLGVDLSEPQKLYLLALVLLVAAALTGRNLARSKIGRSFAAVRDRDIAAEVIGVSLVRTKALAFTISSFYAGVAGALLGTILGVIEPSSYNLLESVRYIAMVLIGGVATISGSIAGALFISLLPRFTEELPRNFPLLADILTGNGFITEFQLQQVLYGVLIVVFLVFEPRGLYGLWIRFRNYWKGWPFSY